MSVQVVDVKTGKVKTMPEKYAKVLVKAKRARWPEPAAPAVESEAPVAEPAVEVELEEAPKKRGRKPKAQE